MEFVHKWVSSSWNKSRKVSKFITGTAEDAIVPITIFYDPETNEILGDTLPEDIREEYAGTKYRKMQD